MIQLSLFDEYPDRPLKGAALAAASAGKSPLNGAKVRRKSADVTPVVKPKRGNRVREQRTSGTLYLPFDDPAFVPIAGEPSAEPVAISPPASQPRPARIERPAIPVNLDLFENLVEEEDATVSVRIAFDPMVWLLRPDSGDFIHMRTGEVREEDEFLPMEMPEVLEEFPDWIEPVD